MKIGYFSYSANGVKAVSLLPKLSVFGYEMVELATLENQPFSPELLGESGIQEVKKLLDSSGLAVSALACHTTFVHSDITEQGKKFDWFCRRVELAAKLGIDILTTATGPVPENLSADTSWDRLIEVTGTILDIVGKFDINLAVEVHAHPREWTGHLADILRLLHAYPDNTRLGVNLDCSHFIVNDDGWKNATTELLPRTIHVHLKGMIMRERKFANCGDTNDNFPAKELITILQSAGYTGTISIENIPSKDWTGKARVSLQYLKKFIGGIE